MDAQQYVVLGLGITGLSVVEHLTQQGITPVVCDSRANPPGREQLAARYPQVRLITGAFPSELLRQAQQLVISPGIDPRQADIVAAAAAGVEIIGDVELFARAATKQGKTVIGITGSNGKTTVTTLVGLMLEADQKLVAVGGNIGTPALDLLAQAADVYVLELSSFQLETCRSLNCVAATCLNVTEDHLDRYDSFEDYRQAKLALARQTQAWLFNRDDQLTQTSAMSSYSFGLQAPDHQHNHRHSQQDDGSFEPAWGIANGYLVHGQQPIIKVSEVGLIGQHNLANILAAMALVEKAGVSYDAMRQVAASFTGLDHRCQKVSAQGGISWVNDSKATNIGATQAALAGLKDYQGQLILIAGGDGKGADFSSLKTDLASVAHLIVFGQDAALLAAQKAGAHLVADLAQAVQLATSLAQTGDMVLLSPACASIDMYPNYMARGEHFKALVEQAYG